MKNLILIIATLILFVSCANPKTEYLEEFGAFINDTELSLKDYSDDDWKYIEKDFNEYSQLQFMDFENELTEQEIDQINSFRERFKKLRVKRDPSGSWLEILGIGKD